MTMTVIQLLTLCPVDRTRTLDRCVTEEFRAAMDKAIEEAMEKRITRLELMGTEFAIVDPRMMFPPSPRPASSTDSGKEGKP